MIFGKNAGLMLKYQKAKAKMVEYDVSKQEYPHFRDYEEKSVNMIFYDKNGR